MEERVLLVYEFDESKAQWLACAAGSSHRSEKSKNGWLTSLLGRNKGSSGASRAPAALSLLTYNIWFDNLEAERRNQMLVELIEEKEPQIVCLQEMTQAAMQRISASAYVRQHYRIVSRYLNTPIDVLCWYAVATLIRKDLPVPRATEIPFPGSTQGRAAIIVRFDVSDGGGSGGGGGDSGGGDSGGGGTATTFQFAVGNNHFESLNSAPQRRVQLQALAQAMERDALSLICGDFNITATGPYADAAEDAAVTAALTLGRYKDAWLRLHGDEPGYTFDRATNSMLGGNKSERCRLDRVLVNKEMVDPTNIEIVGDKPFDDGTKKIWISDHFGVLANLVLKRSD